MASCSVFPAPDACPDKFQLARAFLALLPRGRAWGNHDGGPSPASVLYQFWLAVGDFYTYINQRICAVRAEFFCASAVETADWWLEEYGLPDGCDPFPSACAKILWQASPQCANWVAAAARAGWSITCAWQSESTGARAGCAQAGCGLAANNGPSCWLDITVSLSQSPAYTGALTPPSQPGAMRAGLNLACPPDLTGLKCLLARIIPAHAPVNLEVVS